MVGTVAFVVDKVSGSVGRAPMQSPRSRPFGRGSSEEQRRQELHQAQLKSLQLDNVKKAIEVGDLLNNARPGIVEAMGVAMPELEGPAAARLEALKDQAVEAAVELALTTDDQVIVVYDDQAEG